MDPSVARVQLLPANIPHPTRPNPLTLLPTVAFCSTICLLPVQAFREKISFYLPILSPFARSPEILGLDEHALVARLEHAVALAASMPALNVTSTLASLLL